MSHRQTKLTPARQEKVCAELRRSANLTRAAKAAALAKRTVFEWRERGREEPDSIYGEFLEETDAAIEEWEASLAATIEAHGTTTASSWQALAWLLERRSPDRWGRIERSKVELTGKDGAAIEVEAGGRQKVVAAIERLALRAANADDADDAEA